jgi:hypothetical protein
VLEETLPPEKCLGLVDPATVEEAPKEESALQNDDADGFPPVHHVINLNDFAVLHPLDGF